VEARIKIPKGRGIWPAFWMLGEGADKEGWPACGEIDIMENIGKEPRIIHGSVHGPGYSGGQDITAQIELPVPGALADDFHVYALDWSPDRLVFSFDGRVYQTVRHTSLPPNGEWVFDKQMFLLLNVAVGGDWPGNPDATTRFPEEMVVDYVRVYQAAAITGGKS
jgi:beta-glucanase (GH16 family)